MPSKFNMWVIRYSSLEMTHWSKKMCDGKKCFSHNYKTVVKTDRQISSMSKKCVHEIKPTYLIRAYMEPIYIPATLNVNSLKVMIMKHSHLHWACGPLGGKVALSTFNSSDPFFQTLDWSYAFVVAPLKWKYVCEHKHIIHFHINW